MLAGTSESKNINFCLPGTVNTIPWTDLRQPVLKVLR